ncbi:SDR family NAD(P)-dependent oxidoreductase [Phenylobacterium aquaticum]|uniref:SDR family NAD(P)-dependent oxidoreductase n=1 Tax=Phenylobacterium aquaticum TaxID=1763816 RepID=UPI0026EE115B|nr:SDR family NAD(P)-dependent oxidoreductase [Phenylobacterium aquaticum]
MDRLKGKIAVITGGCAGIGLATVERFEAEGARVLVGDIDDAAGAALEARFPGTVAYRRCDVTDEPQIEALMAHAVDRFGGLDILFNNAGAGGSPQRLEEMTGEAWDRSQGLLLRSVALGMRYALPHMKARGGGAIVNTASIAGLQAGMGPIAYSVAKAGVIHLTKVAAAELARDGVRVNAICPGLILTNIFTPSETVPAGMAELIKQTMAQQAPDAQPIAKPGLPADIANAALFFASDESAFVTGVHMLVDGGMFVGPRQSWDPEMRAERTRMQEARRAAFEAGQAS